MSSSGLDRAHDIIKEADMTKDEIAWLEWEISDEARRQFESGNLEKATTLFNRATYLRAWQLEARLATVGDAARLERDRSAFIRGFPGVLAKANR